MRKVTLQLTMQVILLADEGVGIAEIVSELDCQINDTTTKADILDTEITDYEIIDSK